MNERIQVANRQIGHRTIPTLSTKALDISQQRFGRLVVISFSHVDGRRRAIWRCVCDCGSECEVAGVSLRCGHTKSCGCLGIETRARGTKYRHGKTRSAVWNAWVQMMNRCYNEKTQRFKNYGGRGIKVCDAWQKFDNFYSDMGDPPSGHSLERINVNGNYEPGNCVWVEPAAQYINKTNTRKVRIFGQEVPLSLLVKISGLNYSTAFSRLFTYGWSAERTFPNLRPEDLHRDPIGTGPVR